MIKNIIFDFGGVVIQHKTYLMSGIIKEIFSVSQKEAEAAWNEAMKPLLEGTLSSKEYLQQLKRKFHSDKSVSELLTLWRDLYINEAQNIDWELLTLIDALKKTYCVYLLTDTIDVHDDHNRTRGLYEHFTRVFRSHKEGVSKLTDDAFLRVIHTIRAVPEECVFIDDLDLNVKRARLLGMAGVLYKGRPSLLKSFSELGITVPSPH